MKKLVIVVHLILFSTIISARPIKICTDDNFWYPFTYVKDGKSGGIHVDIVSKALKYLGLKSAFIPRPWKRCLYEAEYGYVDAVVSASYKPERAKYMYYPEDASNTKKSNWRITQVEYIVVSCYRDSYDFKGDLLTLPHPVRAPLGYSIVDDLRKKEIQVETAKGDLQNIKKLLRDKKGVVISLPQIVDYLIKKRRFTNKLKAHPIPIKSKSYFITFSKKGRVSKNERFRIWKEIYKIRNNKELMSKFYQIY